MCEFENVGLISDQESREPSKPTTPVQNRTGTKITPNKDTSPFIGKNIQTPNEHREGMGSRPLSTQADSVKFNSNIDEFKTFIDMDYSDMYGSSFLNQNNKPVKNSKTNKNNKPPKSSNRKMGDMSFHDETHMSNGNI